MKSGKMTDARDQVLTTRFSLRLFMSSTRPFSRSSTNQPFLTERDTAQASSGLRLAVARPDDETAGLLVDAGAVAHGGLAPRSLGRHAGGALALAAAVRMVARVHDDAADLGPAAQVARAAGLAQVLVLMVKVAHLAHGRHAPDADPTDLARGEPDLRVVAFLGEQLRRRAGGADDL